MSDVTLLRTLTRKTVMRFGPHRDLGVEQMLERHIYQLVKVYYNLSAISFTEDVLLEMCIGPNDRISKPGKLTGQAASDAIEAAIARIKSDPEKSNPKRMSLKEYSFARKMKSRTSRLGDSRIFSPDALTRRNHGGR